MPYKDPEARREATKKSWESWRQRNPEKAQASYQKWRKGESGRDYYLWWSAKRRAKRDGTEFTITRADIPPTPEICPIALIPLKFRENNLKGPCNNSPSLDRVDPTKGYTVGNVRVVSHKGNRWKGDMTVTDVERLLKYMKQA